MAVIGGGPAGAAAAIVLARANRRVLLVDMASSSGFKIGETMPPAAWPLLRDLGMAEQARAAGHIRCPGNVVFWGSDSAIERDFIGDIYGEGCHLDRPRFDSDLRVAAANFGAVVRPNCVFRSGRRSDDSVGWEVQLTQGAVELSVRATWLIDATGRRALIATQLGAASEQRDELVALTALVSNRGNTDARTYIEAVEDGWWYSARLPGDRRILGFFTDGDLPASRDASGPEGFSRRLRATRHLRHVVGELNFDAFDRVRRFPAATVVRSEFCGEGWIAVGDATLAFDPLSSQGIFHALYTGIRGAQTILDVRSDGADGALTAWTDRIHAIEAAYRKHLAECYTRETRWPDSDFWQRRQLSFDPVHADHADTLAVS